MDVGRRSYEDNLCQTVGYESVSGGESAAFETLGKDNALRMCLGIGR